MSEKETLLQNALQAVPETILIVDENLTITTVIPNNSGIGITEEAKNRRIDQLPGVSYPGRMNEELITAVRTCLNSNAPTELDFTLIMSDREHTYLKARMHPYEGKYVIVYLKDQTDQVERVKGEHHSDRSHMLELALKKNRISAFSFSFDRFNSCDRVNCNRCFQFYGETNELLNRNKHICRALPVLSHPGDRHDFFFLFNNLRGLHLNEANVSFRLKDDSGEYKQYKVYGKVDAFDNDGMASLIIGHITEKQNTLPSEEKRDGKELK